MTRKHSKNSAVLKRLRVTATVLYVAGMAIWAATLGFGDTNLWFLTPVVSGVLLVAFWAMGEQFVFSFGKSRYLTRTEKKRLRHQRKKGKGDAAAEVLGRKIPQKPQP